MSFYICPSCSNRITTSNVPAIRTCRNRSCKVKVYIHGKDPFAVMYLSEKRRRLTVEMLQSNNMHYGLNEEILDSGERRVLAGMEKEGKAYRSGSVEGGHAWWLTDSYREEQRALQLSGR